MGLQDQLELAVPLFSGIVVKKQLQITDIQIKNQQITYRTNKK